MSIGSYPRRRMRRMRQDPFTRALRRETDLRPEHLVWPIFAVDSPSARTEIPSMAGVFRLGEKDMLEDVGQAIDLGIGAIALFPVTAQSDKTADGRASYDPNGLIPRRIKALKAVYPDLVVISDIALDPYTTHGHDGCIDGNGYVINDETVTILQKQALCHSRAGVDIVAPSDMMDGRIGAIRDALDSHGYQNIRILSYAVKYASAFYGPFRDAIGSQASLKGDKKTYQMDPANGDEALLEAELDVQEGADMLMVKPAMPYLDVISTVRRRFNLPTLAYQVSGEYAMLKEASRAGAIDEKRCVLESLLAMRRAGAHGILTYYAFHAAQWLQEL